MSVTISNNNLTITRGDTVPLLVPLESGGKEFILQKGDKAYLCVKKTPDDKSYSLLKQFYGDGEKKVYFCLEASDTKKLLEKNYVYEVSIEVAVNNSQERFVRTVIDLAQFKITDELY